MKTNENVQYSLENEFEKNTAENLQVSQCQLDGQTLNSN